MTAAGPLTLLVAVTGPAEASLVTALDAAPGLLVVRRCADLVELLAASAAGLGRAALVSADLHHLDAESLAALGRDGTAVVGVLSGAADGGAADQGERARWTSLGVDHLVGPGDPPATLGAGVRAALREDGAAASPRGDRSVVDAAGAVAARVPVPAASATDPPPSAGTGWQPRGAPTVRSGPARVARSPDARDAPDPPRRGRTLAVWGPPGAPGRTMVATSLATALAARGPATLLVDADTTAASVALVLGLLDESAGVAAACRAAAQGRMSPQTLAALAPATAGGLRVLTGLPRAARWPEVGAASLTAVLRTAALSHAWVVVDCASGVEQDEELSYDTSAPRRHAATLTALEQADEVVVVGAGDPVGLQRLVRSLADLREVAPGAAVRVVVTQVRASAVGPSPAAQVLSTLARYAGVADAVLLPDDRPAYDAALLAGRSVAEHGASALRRALVALADTVAGEGEGAAGTGGGARAAGRRR